MIFSVIIPTCNRVDLLSNCLNLLRSESQNIDSKSYEVIVTDDSTSNDTKDFLEKKYSWVNWLPGPKRGPAANRNNGANQAKGEWLVFLDDDCLPDKNLLEKYADGIAVNENTKVFEGLIYCNETIKSPLYIAPVNLTGGYLWSCNFCIEKNLFQKIGKFDENFKYPHLEDNDLCLRIKSHNEEIVFLKSAGVCHPARRIARPSKLVQYHSSWFYYYKKYGQKKTATQLVATNCNHRLRYIIKYKFSKDSIIAFKNLVIEIFLIIFRYGFKKNH